MIGALSLFNQLSSVNQFNSRLAARRSNSKWNASVAVFVQSPVP